MAKKSDQSTKEEQPKCTSNLNSKNNGISAASTVKKLDETKDDEQQKSASSNGPNQKNNKKQEVQTNEQGRQKNLRQLCELQQQGGHGFSPKWEDSLGSDQGPVKIMVWACNTTCKSERNMAFHLNGRKHLEKKGNT
ncbi:hypothetical protein CK203_113783 [Vitis vinifera]|uniref:C2H2-type domain-containing protein n=1 Tax=Vitis vinifera TaxID=29760 RepID=A0A438DL68_VITVI|nr:hypothetical protein CK203_113783 [Vitis vinifera]